VTQPRRILVTGGAGFIGSNLVAALDRRGVSVSVCDLLGDGDKWRNLAKRELADFISVDRLFAYLQTAPKFDAVFHLGAISATTATDGDLVISANYGCSQRLWNYCAAGGATFIYASSAATYGDGERGFVDFESPDELAQLRPMNLYGWSKHLFDRWVARRIVDGDPRPPQWSGLKFFNVYGPNEFHKGSMKSVAAHLFPQLRDGKPARLFRSHRESYADGGQLRDFVSVDDCVEVMLWLLDHPDVSGLFNVGSGTARTFADLARAVIHAMGIDRQIEYIEMPETLREKYQYFTQADLTKLRNAGYVQPMTTLEDGVRRYVELLSSDDPYR
jgi:ADP-L-glycero-D-manno-heptose 6-epimerase